MGQQVVGGEQGGSTSGRGLHENKDFFCVFISIVTHYTGFPNPYLLQMVF